MTGDEIRVVHLLGSLGDGGRESLLLDIIENSPPEISYALWCFQGTREAAEEFERLGVEVTVFDVGSKWDLGGLLAVFRRLRSDRVDVFHLHGPRAQIPGRLMGWLARAGSTVSTHHGVREMFPDRLQRLEAVTRPLDARTVAVSEGVTRSFVGETVPDGWETIHNGIDVDDFNAAVREADDDPVCERYDVEADLVFLNVGRYVPPKAQLDLVEAVDEVRDELPPVHLFVVGGRGAMEGRLREAVGDRGLSDAITVTGAVDDIHEFYAAADVFVSSSIKEGLPIVLLEAMAAELPVVATTIPGVTELVDDEETGLLVPPEQPPRLGDALVRMADPGVRERLAAAGHERVGTEFDVTDTVAGYTSAYRDLGGGDSRE